MAETLGEKLRQAREARGISISEVAEQTRISALYIQSIENDDYRTLPGGIFNKGFVKSFARYVGVDEQEALQDYTRLIVAQQGEQATEEPKTYKPQVLTDDRTSASSLVTIIFAVVILGLMTWGILTLVNYLQNEQATPAGNTNANVNAVNTNVNANSTVPTPSAPSLETAKFEFKATGGDISLTAVTDGKTSYPLVSDGKTVTFEPKTSLKLSYAKSRAQYARLSINGKAITLPAEPANPKRVPVEIEINKDNLAQFWQSGQITFGAANTANPAR